MKRSNVIAAIAIVIIGAVWVVGFWFTEVFHTHNGNASNRAALLRVFEAIDIGNSYSEVLAAFYHQRGQDALGLNVGNPDIWSIDTPLEFGATNWVLHLEFRDGRITAVRVRTLDGPAPRDGPTDKAPAK